MGKDLADRIQLGWGGGNSSLSEEAREIVRAQGTNRSLEQLQKHITTLRTEGQKEEMVSLKLGLGGVGAGQ